MIEAPETQPDVRAALTGVTIMTDVQTTTQTAPKKKAPAKKASAKSAKKSTKKPVAVLKKEGVIAKIVECISKEKGSTVDETLAVLVKAFPERNPDGMRKTAMIQSNKQKTSKEAVDGRGTVFYKRR
jgi:hypothetical protein